MSIAAMPSAPKAGNYAVSTGKVRPWLSTPIVPVPAKARRSKMTPVIKNEIFEECSVLATDPFWVNILHQAALGKFPRGFLFNDSQLVYKRGTRATRLEIPPNASDAIGVIIDFFMKTAGIMSEEDQRRAKEEHDARSSNILSIQNCTWSQIKRDTVKDVLLHEFVTDVTAAFSLNEKEKQQLASTIHIGFFLGYFQPKHVDFREGKICSIDGLNFDSNGRIFSLDSKLTPKVNKSKTSSKNSKLAKNSFMSHWTKFTDKFEKKAPIYTTIKVSPDTQVVRPTLLIVEDTQ